MMSVNSFEPTEMYQHFNSQINFEFLILLSPSKIGVFGRDNPPYLKGNNIPKFIRGTERKPFTAFFIVDYVDVLGVFRRLELFTEFCTMSDYKLMSGIVKK
jgi:hypothetical protein